MPSAAEQTIQAFLAFLETAPQDYATDPDLWAQLNQLKLNLDSSPPDELADTLLDWCNSNGIILDTTTTKVTMSLADTQPQQPPGDRPIPTDNQYLIRAIETAEANRPPAKPSK